MEKISSNECAIETASDQAVSDNKVSDNIVFDNTGPDNTALNNAANEKNSEVQETGAVKISDEVVAIIAGLSAADVKGIAGMSGGIVGGITEFVGKKNPSKGVKVQVGEKEAAVDLFVIVEFGVRIPEVAQEVQRNVKKAIEGMTGLAVVEVNVHIQGVAFPNEVREDEPARIK